jgi:hypothetical protein
LARSQAGSADAPRPRHHRGVTAGPSSRVRRWLLDPGSIYKSTAAQLPDASMQQRLVARAADTGKHWPELPMARKRTVLQGLPVASRCVQRRRQSARGACGMRVDCGQLDPGAVIRPVPGKWHPGQTSTGRSSLLTRRWRKQDSNRRYRVARPGFREGLISPLLNSLATQNSARSRTMIPASSSRSLHRDHSGAMRSAIRSMERSTIHPISCSGDDRVPPRWSSRLEPRHPPRRGFYFGGEGVVGRGAVFASARRRQRR